MLPFDLAPPLRTYLEPRLPFYLEMLEEMVRINSFTKNPAGVNALGDVTAARFADLGFSAERVPAESDEYGHHLVMTRQSTAGDAPTLSLLSHLDTVFSDEEEIRNDFQWRPNGKVIYGPGTVDIKGGTVLMYMLLDGLREFAPDVFAGVNWQILLDAQEETGGLSFGPLCEERLTGTDACLIFEGGNLKQRRFKLVVARKGMASYEMRATGRSAHAGNAHRQGVNAIVQMADIVKRVAALTDYSKRLTFNVGTISGGTVTNRVPHEAEARVEMRTFEQAVFDQGIQDMLALRETASISDHKGNFICQVDIDVVRQTMPWPRNEGTDMLYELWARGAEGIGLQVVEEERGGLSDGNQIWHMVPTIDGLGPAGGNAHCSERAEDGSKDQEFVVPASFVPKTLINTMGTLLLVEQLRTG